MEHEAKSGPPSPGTATGRGSRFHYSNEEPRDPLLSGCKPNPACLPAPDPSVPLCCAQGVAVAGGLLVDVAAGPLHGPGGLNEGRTGAGVSVWVGLVGVGGGNHGVGLGGVLLEAKVGDEGGVALRGWKATAGINVTSFCN